MEKKYSLEFNNLFAYINETLCINYPTKFLSVEYILVAILENKKTHANILLDSCLLLGELVF